MFRRLFLPKKNFAVAVHLSPSENAAVGVQFTRCSDGTGDTPDVATFGAPTRTKGIRRMIASSTQMKRLPSKIGLIAMSRPSNPKETTLLGQNLTTA